MSDDMSSVRTIYIIRHGEKPPDPPKGKPDEPTEQGVEAKKPHLPPPYGVDEDGNENPHSLLPRGWQRAGALVTLFAPSSRRPPVLKTPDEVIAPYYGKPADNAVHRTHQTITPLAQRLKLEIKAEQPENEGAKVGHSIAGVKTGITLICWEHTQIHHIANHIARASKKEIPQHWPGDRFDVVWCFTFDEASDAYVFQQIPQLLLPSDVDEPIPLELKAAPPAPTSGVGPVSR